MKAGIFPVSQHKHRLGKRKKDVKTVQEKVVVSDNSLTGSFFAVSLSRLNLSLPETGYLTSKETHSQSFHDDEGKDKPHHLPTGKGLRVFFPPDTATICQFPCWNMYWSAAACVAAVPAPVHSSAVVGPSHGVRLCCAKPWLGLGGGFTWCLWGPLQHQGVCTTTNQGSKDVTVQTWRVSGEQGQKLSWLKHLPCSPGLECFDLCISWVYFSLGDVYYHYFMLFTFHGTLYMWALVFLCAACCSWLIGGVLRFSGWYLTSFCLNRDIEREPRF